MTVIRIFYCDQCGTEIDRRDSTELDTERYRPIDLHVPGEGYKQLCSPACLLAYATARSEP